MATGPSGPSPSDRHSTAEGLAQAASALIDAMIGVVVGAAAEGRRAGATVQSVAGPLVPLLELPLGVTRGVVQGVARQPWVTDLVEAGTMWRWQATDTARLLAYRVAPSIVDSALRLIDLTDIVRSNVDLNAIVEDVDIDAIVARVDIDSIVDGLDIDDIVSRVDIDAIVDRLDIDAIVARVDLDAIVDRIDIDAIAARINIDAILDRVDVDSVVAKADFDAIIAKIDLIELAEFVVEGIDLPGMIRSSTGSMASEGIREVRRQGISADERVAHIVDRLLRRPDRSPGSVNHVAVLTAIPAQISGEGRAPSASIAGSGPDAAGSDAPGSDPSGSDPSGSDTSGPPKAAD